MGGRAKKFQFKGPHGGHRHTGADAYGTGVEPILDMHPNNQIDVVHHTVINHIFRTAVRAFLAGLKQKLDPTGKLIPYSVEGLGRAKKHGGMGIVPAGVHFAWFLGFVVYLVNFLYG
ncbi:hypothetical protein SDC9_196850 [bioreactor metagenome]|uniref:Uncharacterized protein n=1 Tax=bioreactor metagenome TaxID=1076179 RepID=A0A645ID57_9ZZZZ